MDQTLGVKNTRRLHIAGLVIVMGSVLLSTFFAASASASATAPVMIRAHIMVRNEEHALPRLLESIEPLVQGILLCDTGSTDQTVSLARRWAQQQKKSIEVAEGVRFVNFEQARNECLDRLVRRRIPPVSSGENDWVLLMDADFTATQTAPMHRPAPSPPEYDINTIQIRATQPGHQPHNSLPMLIRTRVLANYCRYRLWTHEFLECTLENVLPYRSDSPVPLTSGFYNDIFFRDHADGSSRAEKLDRDIRLLTEWLASSDKKESELRPRATYYLARAYEDRGEYDEAKRWYEEHNKVQPMTNYQFYAHYRLALIQLSSSSSSFEDKVDAFHRAFGTYDGIFRREPLYYLARLHRERGDFDRCIIYGTAGMNLPPVEHTRVPLFLEPLIYDWVLEEELAFCLYKKMHFAKALAHFRNIRSRHFSQMDLRSQQRLDEEIAACSSLR